MKTINLRGITESLSESEMKMVKGGANVVDTNKNQTVAEEACMNKIPDATCSMGTGAAKVGGICVFYKNAPMRCE